MIFTAIALQTRCGVCIDIVTRPVTDFRYAEAEVGAFISYHSLILALLVWKTVEYMSSCLSQRFIFGVRGHRSSALEFCDESTLVYVAGHNVVVQDIDEGKQRFINGSERSTSITAVALCPSARIVALAEDGEKPTVKKYG